MSHDDHDHELHITGIWEGDVMMDIHCVHSDDDIEWFKDAEGEVHVDCLVQLWFDADRRDVFGTITRADANQQGTFLLYTTWNLDLEPKLVGKSDFQDWTDSL